MAKVSKNDRNLFVRWGKVGGKTRAKKLSRVERSRIASHAAQIRWKSAKNNFNQLISIRLNEARWDDPVFLEEILSEGSLESWRELFRQLIDHPFGKIAEALSRVVNSTQIYGATPLWKGIINTIHGKGL